MQSLECSKGETLRGKAIGLCVTGSIAAVETVKLARELRRHGASVLAVMSQAAKDIIHPNALEFATGQRVIDSITGGVEHVRFAGSGPGKLDLLLICPCTLNTLSKVANGISDTPPTLFAATALSHIPVIMVPTMHRTMYDGKAAQENMRRLRSMGVKVIEGKDEEGKMKMPSVERILFEVEKTLSRKDFQGKRVLVTAGPTIERIDDVRFITNKSTGKMGIAIAEELERRGADVRLVLGRTSEPTNIENMVRRETFEAMHNEVIYGGEFDIFVLAMAASDFTVEKRSGKVPSGEGFSLEFIPNKKIISELRKRTSSMVVGFKAEYDVSEDELIERATSSLRRNGLDMVVANDVGKDMRGFGHDTNEVFIVKRNGEVVHLPLVSKASIARGIADCIATLLD
ncbi:MAG: bifunctional phosphopantothenoylcysteine decarboxylase/phosphopantothenate--cysteine ligase CoaBC [Candidatus Methanofastidiosa archaeon]|nr:bifunctional phosphopantothenoylcysteine decarboxylase/phosphopantothenate--cysteine ligase CoaBC [Candidatus Methanofastidiosa archaeon]